MISLLLLAVLGLGVQDPEAQASTTDAPESQEPAQDPSEDLGPGAEAAPAPPVFDHDFSLEEIVRALDGLVAAYPELASVQTLGHSQLGHEVHAVALTDPSTGAAEEKPGLLFVDYSGPGVTRGAESVLAFGWMLAERAGQDTDLAGLLADHVVYLVPACDPDLRVVEDRTQETTITFDRNFPLGWQPDSLRAGSGAYPLARAETMGLARFLAGHPNLVLIVAAGAPEAGAEGPWQGAQFPDADRRALDELCAPFARGAEVELLPWHRLGSPGGGLLDYAYQALGIYPVAWVGTEGAEADTARVEAIAAGTLELLGHMPRMGIETHALREVAPGLWELDLAIANAGVLPTLSALAADRRVAGELYLDVAGTKLVATARRRGATGPFRTARLQPAGEAVDLMGSTLGGGETRWLRLILEGEAGAVIELEGIGSRAGSMRLELELR